jgi:Holliday junction resolvase RusA-like endonuclease
VISFTVPGKPGAKGRPRISTRGGFARAYTPAETVSYENKVAFAGRDAMAGRQMLDQPLRLRVMAIFDVPASWSGKKKVKAMSGEIRPTGKPDADNVLKIVGDALNGIVWRDDSIIVEATVIKSYGAAPGVCVMVEAV